jgi:hypothetical protein
MSRALFLTVYLLSAATTGPGVREGEPIVGLETLGGTHSLALSNGLVVLLRGSASLELSAFDQDMKQRWSVTVEDPPFFKENVAWGPIFAQEYRGDVLVSGLLVDGFETRVYDGDTGALKSMSLQHRVPGRLAHGVRILQSTDGFVAALLPQRKESMVLVLQGTDELSRFPLPALPSGATLLDLRLAPDGALIAVGTVGDDLLLWRIDKAGQSAPIRIGAVPLEALSHLNLSFDPKNPLKAEVMFAWGEQVPVDRIDSVWRMEFVGFVPRWSSKDPPPAPWGLHRASLDFSRSEVSVIETILVPDARLGELAPAYGLAWREMGFTPAGEAWAIAQIVDIHQEKEMLPPGFGVSLSGQPTVDLRVFWKPTYHCDDLVALWFDPSGALRRVSRVPLEPEEHVLSSRELNEPAALQYAITPQWKQQVRTRPYTFSLIAQPAGQDLNILYSHADGAVVRRSLNVSSGEVGPEQPVYADPHKRMRGDYSIGLPDGSFLLVTSLPWDAWEGELRWVGF